MTCFVRQYIDVATCTIKIGKNIGRPVFPNERAIAACCLTIFRYQIHEVVVAHEAEKFIRIFG